MLHRYAAADARAREAHQRLMLGDGIWPLGRRRATPALMEQDGGGPRCGRCDGRLEVGELTAGAGLIVGLGPWGKLGWISDPTGRRYSETLAKSTLGVARVVGFRCETCRLIWFQY